MNEGISLTILRIKNDYAGWIETIIHSPKVKRKIKIGHLELSVEDGCIFV